MTVPVLDKGKPQFFLYNPAQQAARNGVEWQAGAIYSGINQENLTLCSVSLPLLQEL